LKVNCPPQNREFTWLEVAVTRGVSPLKGAIPKYPRFSQKIVLPIYVTFFKNFARTPEHPLNPMPPKVDPYATPAQRRIDALLIVITAITVAILLLTGSHGRAADSNAQSTATPHASR
jgi:hypothetical protein